MRQRIEKEREGERERIFECKVDWVVRPIWSLLVIGSQWEGKNISVQMAVMIMAILVCQTGPYTTLVPSEKVEIKPTSE